MQYYITLIFFLAGSCFQMNKTDNTDAVIVQKKVTKITCYLITLEGEYKIYTLEKDYIYIPSKNPQKITFTQEKAWEVPKEIMSTDKKYGCGTCTDQIDYKFIFESNDTSQTVWEIDPGSRPVPDFDDYFDILIEMYNEVVNN